ncbi:MAG: GNAT family N-acetyltransferase [Pseudomonadales bacterium]|nr:GNAT family N-acetyltransferase [Pseudomonadales bacterium]
MEYCIRESLSIFEPGAQGQHKISRGFIPARTLSAHWISDPHFEQKIVKKLPNVLVILKPPFLTERKPHESRIFANAFFTGL